MINFYIYNNNNKTVNKKKTTCKHRHWRMNLHFAVDTRQNTIKYANGLINPKLLAGTIIINSCQSLGIQERLLILIVCKEFMLHSALMPRNKIKCSCALISFEIDFF